MILEQVTSRAYANTSGESRGNFGAINLPNYLVAIDSGMYPSVAEEFRTHIEKTTGKPVKKLILTHYHADHVFGNQIFSDCEIISSRAMAAGMREVAASQWTREKLEETAKMRPDSFKKLDFSNLKITFPTVVFDDSSRFFDEEFEILIKKVARA